MLKAENIYKRYPNGILALRGASLVLRRGETLGLIGDSGCGKSTLARVLCGLESYHFGRVVSDGRPCMVWQDASGSLNPKLTAARSVAEPLENQRPKLSRPEREKRVEDLLCRMGLRIEDGKKYPHELSGGQRQRIVIARALASEPDYLICDEPVSGLDAEVQAQVLDLLRAVQLRRSMGCLFITHDPALAEAFCGAVLFMNAGVIGNVADGQ